MSRKTLLSWSSGKDSAWTLHVLKQQQDVDLVGLFCTINKKFDRVAMHGVRVELLKKQAKSIGLPLEIIDLPFPCSNSDYENIMGQFIEKAKDAQIDDFAFGDLFLEDVRNYRIAQLQDSGIQPVFPIWGRETDQLAREMIRSGLRTVITCLDPKQTPEEFIGKEFNEEFLDLLPETVDPCGENGEFHSFVFDGPMFQEKIEITVGEVVHRDGFVFADVLPRET